MKDTAELLRKLDGCTTFREMMGVAEEMGIVSKPRLRTRRTKRRLVVRNDIVPETKTAAFALMAFAKMKRPSKGDAAEAMGYVIKAIAVETNQGVLDNLVAQKAALTRAIQG